LILQIFLKALMKMELMKLGAGIIGPCHVNSFQWCYCKFRFGIFTGKIQSGEYSPRLAASLPRQAANGHWALNQW
jgi:hypothetical protein